MIELQICNSIIGQFFKKLVDDSVESFIDQFLGKLVDDSVESFIDGPPGAS